LDAVPETTLSLTVMIDCMVCRAPFAWFDVGIAS
jgi:hypothetical protein